MEKFIIDKTKEDLEPKDLGDLVQEIGAICKGREVLFSNQDLQSSYSFLQKNGELSLQVSNATGELEYLLNIQCNDFTMEIEVSYPIDDMQSDRVKNDLEKRFDTTVRAY